jgi:hypothetical protein
MAARAVPGGPGRAVPGLGVVTRRTVGAEAMLEAEVLGELGDL